MNTPYSVKKPTVKKNGEKSERTEWVCNSDKVKDFIAKFGKERFDTVSKTDENWKKFVPPEFPTRFTWIWYKFLDIWRTCGHDFNGNIILTPRVLMDYCECFMISLTVEEKRLIFRMKAWAEDTIYKLRKKD